jgi:cell division protein FtsW
MKILAIWVTLILFGLLAIYSVSIHESFTLTLRLINSGIMTGDPSNYFYFGRQLTNIFFALWAWLVTMFVPIQFFQKQKNVIVMFALVFVLQLMVFIPGVWLELNGARGRIDVPLLPTIQPAEFFKLAYILFLSSRLIRKTKDISGWEFPWKFLVINAVCLIVFVAIHDIGTILILWLVGLIILWYAGAKIKHVLFILFGGILLWSLAWLLAWKISTQFNYLQKRFVYFIDSSVDPQWTDIGRQNQQALIAVGGGGFIWKWYGKGLQKFGYIPEAQSDFIFSAFAEEIGFLWNMVLLSLYFYLCYYFLTNLYMVKDPYVRTVGVGIISLIIIQMFVNIGVNLKIMPNTWLTLPFISYGWTALMVNVIEIVLLYKILQSWKKMLPR